MELLVGCFNMNLITPPVRTIKDVIKDEIIHCAKDPSYFLTKFVYIQHPTTNDQQTT